MQIQNFTFECPVNIKDAIKLVEAGGVLIAGGSDVMPQLKTETIHPETLVDLAEISELKCLEERPDGLHIGGMVTLAHLAQAPAVQRLVPALGQAARNVASPQIRNRGTIAGNVMQARRCIYYNQTKNWRDGMPVCYKVGGDTCLQGAKSPVCRALYYSDVATALLLYDARVRVMESSGEHELTAHELITAHIEDRDRAFVITEFFLPKESYGSWSKFLKYSLRGSIDFPVVNFSVKRTDNDYKLFAGAIAPNILELSETAEHLNKHENWTVMEALDLAVAEMNKKAMPIREAGLSIKVKKGSYLLIEELLIQLRKHWSA